jgi:hypothetical protein
VLDKVRVSLAITASTRKLASYNISNLNGLSLEAEIRSLFSLGPESLKQLPTLFAESVMESCSAIAGASSGEALVRRLGDEQLQNPERAFQRIDTLLGGGSDTLKRAIEQRFRGKVHRLYKISMSLEAKRLSAS